MRFEKLQHFRGTTPGHNRQSTVESYTYQLTPDFLALSDSVKGLAAGSFVGGEGFQGCNYLIVIMRGMLCVGPPLASVATI